MIDTRSKVCGFIVEEALKPRHHFKLFRYELTTGLLRYIGTCAWVFSTRKGAVEAGHRFIEKFESASEQERENCIKGVMTDE